MKTSVLSAAFASAALSLALSPTALAQGGVVWNSINDGTLGGSTVTMTGVVSNSSIVTSDLSNFNYDFAPLSQAQDTLSYGANDAWTADFSPALTDGVLWYGVFIRGAGSFPPAGADSEYTFSQPPIIVAGFTQGTVIGNTIALPTNTFHFGILMFAGPIDTLSVTSNGVGPSFQSMTFGEIPPPDPIGTNFCMANPNSTGGTGVISAIGSTTVTDNDLTLTASGLPNVAFGFFVTSLDRGFVMNPAGSSGNLCLSGAIGRYVGPGQIQSTGQTGQFSLSVDLTQIPTPTGFVQVAAGETRVFQAWHRDSNAAGATSNFTDGLEIQFM